MSGAQLVTKRYHGLLEYTSFKFDENVVNEKFQHYNNIRLEVLCKNQCGFF